MTIETLLCPNCEVFLKIQVDQLNVMNIGQCGGCEMLFKMVFTKPKTSSSDALLKPSGKEMSDYFFLKTKSISEDKKEQAIYPENRKTITLKSLKLKEQRLDDLFSCWHCQNEFVPNSSLTRSESFTDCPKCMMRFSVSSTKIKKDEKLYLESKIYFYKPISENEDEALLQQAFLEAYDNCQHVKCLDNLRYLYENNHMDSQTFLKTARHLLIGEGWKDVNLAGPTALERCNDLLKSKGLHNTAI